MSRFVGIAPVRVKKAPEPKLTDELVHYILKRDGACVLSFLVTDHACRDRWGNYHRPDQLDKLSMEHVLDSARKGKRARNDKWHLVAACHYSNEVSVETSKYRQKIREYLAEKEPKSLDIDGG